MKENQLRVDKQEYDEEMELVFSSTPSWIVRNGSALILLILIGLFLLSFVIMLPQTVKGSIVVYSYPSSVTLLAKASGRVLLFKKDGELVSKNSILGYIENTANITDIFSCTKFILNTKSITQNNSSFDSIRYDPFWNLGELQPYLLSFLKSLEDYRTFIKLESYSKQLSETQIQLSNYRNLIRGQELEESLLRDELTLSNEILKRDSILYSSKVIAASQYETSKLSAFPYKRNYQNIQQSITNTRITISNLISKTNTLLSEKRQKESDYVSGIKNALYTLDHKLQEWNQKYLFTSTIDGTIVFYSSLTSNQNVSIGESILTVVPAQQEVLGKMTVATMGAGRIRAGQSVLISLDDYPQTEYGRVKGYIKMSPTIQKDGQYNLFVDIPGNILTTDYKKEIPAKDGMKGTAVIVTRDTRLIDHLFRQLREAFRTY